MHRPPPPHPSPVQIIYLNRTPDEAYDPLTCGEIPPYIRFCDASYGPSPYKVSLLDCLQAVYKAHRAGFFSFDDFDVDEYEYYEVWGTKYKLIISNNNFLTIAI